EQMHTAETRAGYGDVPGSAAGGQEERVVTDGRAGIEANRLRPPVYFHGATPEMGLDALVRIESRRPDQQLLAIHPSREEFLGERRALVGQPRLLAHQG